MIIDKTEVIESGFHSTVIFRKEKGRSKFTVRSPSGCLTRYNTYLLSHLLCTGAHLCLQKKEKRRTPSEGRPGNSKFRLASSVDSISKLRAHVHVPHPCVYAYTHGREGGGRMGWKKGRDTVAFSTLQPMQQWRLRNGGSRPAQCAADVFI